MEEDCMMKGKRQLWGFIAWGLMALVPREAAGEAPAMAVWAEQCDGGSGSEVAADRKEGSSMGTIYRMGNGVAIGTINSDGEVYRIGYGSLAGRVTSSGEVYKMGEGVAVGNVTSGGEVYRRGNGVAIGNVTSSGQIYRRGYGVAVGRVDGGNVLAGGAAGLLLLGLDAP
jgi:hypothetical protein